MSKLKSCGPVCLALALLISMTTGCRKVIEYPPDKYSDIYSDVVIDEDSAPGLDEDPGPESKGYDDTWPSTPGSGNGILVDDVIFGDDDFKTEEEELLNLGQDIAGGKAFFVRSFGAKGDGKTDDSTAVNKAIATACTYTKKNSGKVAQVRFEENTEYVLKTCAAGSSSLMQISGAQNVSLIGNNTTVIGLPGKGYLSVVQSESITVKGFNFNYDTPVACVATVEKCEGSRVTFSVPAWFAECARRTPEYTKDAFALKANGLRGQVPCTIATALNDTHVEIAMSGAQEIGSVWYLPTPGYSHSGVAFQVLHNTGEVTYEDIRIWNASMFVFQVNGNFGKLYWRNVRLEPKDADSCATVAWRDVVHAKDNRESLHFDQCVFGGSHDDIFNIANTLAQITEIGEENELKIVGLDYAGGGFARIEEGDTAVILNPDEGIRCGEAKVVEVISQTSSSIRIRLDRSFDLDGGEYLYFKEMASPKTTITNCRLDGTFRIRAQATIENCTINVLQMWTHYSGLTSEVEGPIPENITYRNCAFTHPAGTSNVFDFNCETKSGAVAGFTVSNILFDGCIFQDSKMIREQPGVVLKDPKFMR